jgi:2-dehydro-3-deoxygluconokinase
MSKVVTFGEIMLRLATPEFLRFSQATEFEATYGGGEANVAVSLANYGMDGYFVTSLPKNDIGDAAIASLRKYNVKTDFIHRGGDRIGIYFLESGAVSRASKVIYDRANSSLANIKKGSIDWDKALDGAEWFHWTGITPSVSHGAAEACMEACEAAAKKGITISTDLNYRAKLWKWGKSAGEVMEDLVKHCDVIL